MNNIIKLFIIVTIFSAIAGLALGAVNEFTKDTIELQVVKYVKGPAIEKIFADATNNPLEDRKKIKDGEKEIDIFIGEFNGRKNAVAFEAIGKGGYAGDVGVMVAFDLDTDELVGIGVTTSGETPGLGSRAKTDPKFAGQFKGLSAIESVFKIRPAGGDIDALSGATLTSNAVCGGVTEAVETYKRLKEEILKNI